MTHVSHWREEEMQSNQINRSQSMSVRPTVMCLIVSALGCGPASAGIVWSDEFNGSAIDSGTWTYDVGGGGWGNGQFEYDTARHENSYVTNGNLVIEARRESYMGNAFTSARMMTQGRFAFKYGTLEARIKLPEYRQWFVAGLLDDGQQCRRHRLARVRGSWTFSRWAPQPGSTRVFSRR